MGLCGRRMGLCGRRMGLCGRRMGLCDRRMGLCGRRMGLCDRTAIDIKAFPVALAPTVVSVIHIPKGLCIFKFMHIM